MENWVHVLTGRLSQSTAFRIYIDGPHTAADLVRLVALLQVQIEVLVEEPLYAHPLEAPADSKSNFGDKAQALRQENTGETER